MSSDGWQAVIDQAAESGRRMAALRDARQRRDYRAEVVVAAEAGDWVAFMAALERFVDWRIRRREVGK